MGVHTLLTMNTLWHSNDMYRRVIYRGLVERYEKAKVRFDEVTAAIGDRAAKSERLAGFIKTLRAQTEPLAEFDERLWGCMVDYVTVGVDGGMMVVFRDGTETRENMA